jgi:hypothetical protein
LGLPIDEATSRFLKTAGADLQGRLGELGKVEELKVDDRSRGVTLITRVRVGSRVLDYRATGDNLVEAYAALTHGIASQHAGESSATDP